MPPLDPKRKQRAGEYARLRRRLWLIDTAFGAVYALAWLFLGWTISLRNLLTGHWPFLANDWLLVPAFVLVFGGIYFALNLPLGYYNGFVLPHRFGQSTQSLKDWVLDQLKGLAIGAPLGLIILEMAYAFLRFSPAFWWLWLAGGLLIANVLLSNLAPILIMLLFHKFVPLGDEHKDLADRLMKFAERAHTKRRGVFKFDMSLRTRSANTSF